MPSKVPSDLINQSQIGFREVAGLSSFNPQHPTLKSLQTVQNSISALDPSPSRFQCKHCEAKLLRGSQSLICIYCGQCQAKDLPPEPIVFNSTTGYRWLLQSLHLNASEMIEPLVEEKRKNKVGTPVEGGKALSEFLDVQIRWPDELEIPETSYVNKMLDHSSSLHFSRIFSDNFEQMDSHSGSDASEEHAVSSKDDQIDGIEDQDNLSLFQKFDVPETAANMFSDLSGERETELQPSNSSAQNEDSLSGDDTEIQSVNEDYSKSTAARDSLSGNEEEIESVNSRRQNEDSKSDSSGHDAEIQPVNSRVDDDLEDSKDIAADLSRDSSSGDESTNFRRPNKDSRTADMSSSLSDDGHEAAVNSRAQNEATVNVSTDLKRDSSSGDDAEIQSRGHNEGFETATISSNLKDHGNDAEIDPKAQNKESEATAAMVSDLKRDSSSGDESMNFGRPNKDSKTPERSSNLSDDGHEAAVNSKAQDEDFKATTHVSTDLNRDSSSGDDAEIHSRRQNEASETATISSNSFGNDAEIDPRAQNEESKVAMESDLKRDSSSGDETEMNSKTVSVSFDLSGDGSSSGHDVETQPVDSRVQIKYSRATAVDLRRNSSSEDDIEIHSMNSKDSKTAAISSNLSEDDLSEQNSRIQNQDSKTTAVMSDLSRDSSSGDENSRIHNENSRISAMPSNLSDDDADIHPVNSRAHNEDSKDSSSGDDNSRNINVDSKTAAISLDSMNSRRWNEDSKATTDLSKDSSSGDENSRTLINANSRRWNEDSKATTDLRKDSSSEDEDSRTQNRGSTASAILSHDDSSSGHDAEIQSVNSRTMFEDDSKTTSAISPRDSFSGDENPRNSSSTHATTVSFYDLHGGHDVEIESLNSRRWNQDSRTRSQDSKTTVYHDLSGDGSSGDDTEFQSGHSRWNTSTAKSYDFRTDSSSGDDLQIHSRLQNHDFNSFHHKEESNPHPSISDDKVQDKD